MKMDIEKIFTDIYRYNIFGGIDSISGPGSSRDQTRMIIDKLPIIFHDFHISTLLDIPCGDFHWMSAVNLNAVDYIGADIVKELINRNRKYEKDNIVFKKMNLITDTFPRVNLILCRDCFVHFSYSNILQSLQNIYKSKSQYLLTTTFSDYQENHNILTGLWRPLNLEIAPFNFPKPILCITEKCTEGNGSYCDKSLGLWRIDDIKMSL